MLLKGERGACENLPAANFLPLWTFFLLGTDQFHKRRAEQRSGSDRHDRLAKTVSAGYAVDLVGAQFDH